jgi:hypothetical protein
MIAMRSWLLGIAVATLAFDAARCDFEEIAAVANQCWPNSVSLQKDRTILCFDGPIGAEQNPGVFHELKQDGFFVMRSPGGHAYSSMLLANILREKNATVIVYDYCLSACANYFLIAASKTYVRKDTIVAWHGGTPKYDCNWIGLDEMRRRYRRRHDLAEDDAAKQVDEFCKATGLAATFFKERGIDDRHIHAPQTAYTHKMVRMATSERLDKRSVFWMWNPKNQSDYFKSRVIYESYPTSQDHVNEIARRMPLLRLPLKVYYDP